ncbi:MAG: hypothetical protein CSA21_04000 [Deltaproteobacteria bacterium]|nr:MAG: hypothetical protein CSA21_04000 [Deltaproteobacteria bacterium]
MAVSWKLNLLILATLHTLCSTAQGVETAAPPVVAGGPPSDSCEPATRREQSNQKLAAELRGIRREIAALRQEIEEPGINEAFAGIGYILGLFGVASLVMANKKKNGASLDS